MEPNQACDKCMHKSICMYLSPYMELYKEVWDLVTHAAKKELPGAAFTLHCLNYRTNNDIFIPQLERRNSSCPYL